MNNKNFIGTFLTEEEAIRKIQELKTQGYDGSDIYAIARDEHDISMLRGRTDVEVKATDDGEIGWLDRFMAFLSGEEPVRGALGNMGLDEAEADRYYRDIESGSILLYVDKEYDNIVASGSNIVHEADVNLGPDPLNREQAHLGSHDYEENELDVNMDMDNETRLNLHEEKLRVDKDRVQSGEVQVDKHVVEDEQRLDVPLKHEEVYVERRPVNGQDLDEATATFDDNDGESIRIPITEERIEVTKKPVVSEEIVIGKYEVEDTETVRETVKREEADIERTGSANLQGDVWNNEAGSRYNRRKQTTLGAENDAEMSEEDRLRARMDISAQAEIDEELDKKGDEYQTRDDNPYTNPNQDSRF